METILFVDHYKENQMKFWKKHRGVMKINAYQLVNFLIKQLGICKVGILDNTYLAQNQDGIAELLSIEQLSQLILSYIKKNFPNEANVIDKTEILDALVEKSKALFDDKVLNYLPIHKVSLLYDTKSSSEIAFKNLLVKRTAQDEHLVDYRNCDSIILKNQIVDRNYIPTKRKCVGEFVKFVWNLAGHSPRRFKVLCSILGYLLHRYKNPANPKMIILIDQVIAELESSNGGSGKSILASAISHIRNVIEVSGKKFKSGEKFSLQRVDVWTDVVLVNDASKNENLENWYNVLADGCVMERKYEKEQYIPYSHSFKVVMTTNHMIKQPEGNSSERRKHEVEVSDYYGKHLTPEQEFGHILFTDWDTEQWNQFDNFMVFCLGYYLQFGLIEPPKINILKRKLISEVGIALIELMDEKIQAGTTRFHKKDTYDEYVKGGYVDRKYVPQRNSFTRKLRKYFEYKELPYTETPSDSKKYFELVTEQGIEEITTQTLKDKEVKYSLVDTHNKLTRLQNNLKTELK